MQFFLFVCFCACLSVLPAADVTTFLGTQIGPRKNSNDLDLCELDEGQEKGKEL